MGSKEQITFVTNRITKAFHELFRVFERLQRELPGVKSRIRSDWIKLYGSKPFFYIFRCPFCSQFRVVRLYQAPFNAGSTSPANPISRACSAMAGERRRWKRSLVTASASSFTASP